MILQIIRWIAHKKKRTTVSLKHFSGSMWARWIKETTGFQWTTVNTDKSLRCRISRKQPMARQHSNLQWQNWHQRVSLRTPDLKPFFSSKLLSSVQIWGGWSDWYWLRPIRGVDRRITNLAKSKWDGKAQRKPKQVLKKHPKNSKLWEFIIETRHMMEFCTDTSMKFEKTRAAKC